MKDVMASIRMPKTLLEELRKQAAKEHFLDLSELIRHIARKKWMQHANPELHELKKLRHDIGSELKQRSAEKARQEVNKELSRIREELKKRGVLDEKGR